MLALILMLATSVFCGAGGVHETPAAAASVAASQFGYDAIDGRHRKQAKVESGAEDVILKPADRTKLVANSRDLARNASIFGWCIRKHLDYVSTFDFHSRTGDKGLDDHIEALMEDWSRPTACDVASRHTLAKMLRLGEARRTVDGDMGFIKLGSGELQAIEGDRVRDVTSRGAFVPGEPTDGAKWIHGVKCDSSGRALAYAVHKRTGMNSYEFERTIPASRMAWFGYYDRFDQVRGVSPIASAINEFRDTYSMLELARLKAKVTQFFALALFRDASLAAGEMGKQFDADGNVDRSTSEVDLGAGPALLDLKPGAKAEFLESKHPSTEFQAFIHVSIAIGLKALDMPYSFYDESFTNFFGSRAAWLHYQRSCLDKWADAIELRRKITLWRYTLWTLDNTITLKKSQTIRDLRFEWIPRGMPWWDPSKEINGVVQEIKAGLNNPINACRERGTDYFDNIDQTAKAIQYAADNKVPVEFALVAPPAVNAVEADDA